MPAPGTRVEKPFDRTLFRMQYVVIIVMCVQLLAGDMSPGHQLYRNHT